MARRVQAVLVLGGSGSRMTYDLRRLRLKGIIERLVGTQRYRLTETGLKTVLFYLRVSQRVLRPGPSLLEDRRLREGSPLVQSYQAFHTQLAEYFQLQLAACKPDLFTTGFEVQGVLRTTQSRENEQ